MKLAPPDRRGGSLRPTLDSPSALGPYRIVRRIAAGGMGVVYEAVHSELGRRVAIKTLRDDFAREHAHALDRFRQEAIATASLHHPHIVQVTDFAVGPPTYLVMEMLAGESLRSRLGRPDRLTTRDACAIVVQILSALDAAHAAGIVHRDIKPENVFIVATAATPVFVKVLDFGIAKLLDQKGPPLTRSDEILGSLAYMPPEQIGAGDISERSDVYSVGVLLYELLAGRKPYEAESPAALVATILRGAKPGPIAGVPAPLLAIVSRAMATLASERFASAGEMRVAVEAATAVATLAEDLPTDVVRPRGFDTAREYASAMETVTVTERIAVDSRPNAGSLMGRAPVTQPSGPPTLPNPSPLLAPHTEKLRQTYPPPHLTTVKLGPPAATPTSVPAVPAAAAPLPVTLPSVLAPVGQSTVASPRSVAAVSPTAPITPQRPSAAELGSERPSRAGAAATRFRPREIAKPAGGGGLRVVMILGLLLALGSAVAYATAMYIRHR